MQPHAAPPSDRVGVLAAVAAGGAVGSGARYGVGLLLPHDPAHGFPWSTVTVNGVGCLLIGVLMVLVTEAFTVHRLLRPFLGVGVLGGFTTFSTSVGDVRALVDRGAVAAAVGYLALTVVLAFAAVGVGVVASRFAVRPARRRSHR